MQMLTKEEVAQKKFLKRFKQRFDKSLSLYLSKFTILYSVGYQTQNCFCFASSLIED